MNRASCPPETDQAPRQEAPPPYQGILVSSKIAFATSAATQATAAASLTIRSI